MIAHVCGIDGIVDNWSAGSDQGIDLLSPLLRLQRAACVHDNSTRHRHIDCSPQHAPLQFRQPSDI
jgi:hypothetical protein